MTLLFYTTMAIFYQILDYCSLILGTSSNSEIEKGVKVQKASAGIVRDATFEKEISRFISTLIMAGY